ncbi:MAG: DUF2786 domain-containing protein [Bdellovibrionota bacterium]
MIIYDQTALAFIKKAEAMARKILTEVGVDVRRQRFKFNNFLFPIHVVVFEGDKKLGYFDSKFWQIGLNRKLIWMAKEDVLRDVLKHELAHYLTFIQYPESQPHGTEFKKVCTELGFASEVSAATTNLEIENERKEGDLDSERVLEKVKKLLQLAQSTDTHEAELATVRANEILLRYNLSLLGSLTDDEPLYMDRIFEQPRRNAKIDAIYDILRHFIVRPVLSHTKDTCVLEVTGSLTNVKLARYIAGFLDRELDTLWQAAQKAHELRGRRAKNSFFLGVARGFDEKMKVSKESFSPTDKKSLVTIEEKLNVDMRAIYRRLSYSASSSRTDENAQSVGHKKGRELNIRAGVESKRSGLLLK